MSRTRSCGLDWTPPVSSEQVKNPRYQGATPEDVARALLRAPRSRREPVVRDEVAVEQPLADEAGDDVRHLR